MTGQRGSWRSSNPAVINIDGSSGVGVAVGPGTATLYHDIAGKLETQAEVSLKKVLMISKLKKLFKKKKVSKIKHVSQIFCIWRSPNPAILGINFSGLFN